MAQPLRLFHEAKIDLANICDILTLLHFRSDDQGDNRRNRDQPPSPRGMFEKSSQCKKPQGTMERPPGHIDGSGSHQLGSFLYPDQRGVFSPTVRPVFKAIERNRMDHQVKGNQ